MTVLTVLALTSSKVSADFTQAQTVLHPQYPGTGPFIIEIRGSWPTDCHPGEQKPVVENSDGQAVDIGFEIIVVHVTCNDVETPYRVLVDLSGAVRETEPAGNTLEVRAFFQGATLERTLNLVCPGHPDCAGVTVNPVRPEPGLYAAAGRANQGLLVARQHAAMAVYPLVYDGSGGSEWLFTGNLLLEDGLFTEILRFSGGDCFGCEPSGKVPEQTQEGHITVLADGPGVLQVKVNDGLFTEYRRSVFGYRTFQVGPAGESTLVDIEGRWGISENRGTNPPAGNLAEFLPGAFDIRRKDILPADDGILPGGQVSYLVTTLLGETLGELVCRGETAAIGDFNVCEFIDPTDAAETLFLFHQQGPSTLLIVYGRPTYAVGTPPGGRAVRLD